VQAHSGCLQVLEQPQGNHWPARNARGAIRATHLGEGEPPARTPRRHRRLTHTEMTQAVASDGRCRSPPVGWLTSPCFVPDMGPAYETMRLTADDVTGPAPRIGQGHRLVPSPRREARSTQSHAAQHPARICSPDSAKHLNAALRGCASVLYIRVVQNPVHPAIGGGIASRLPRLPPTIEEHLDTDPAGAFRADPRRRVGCRAPQRRTRPTNAGRASRGQAQPLSTRPSVRTGGTEDPRALAETVIDCSKQS
jgi:hypothetical protein